MPDAGEFIRSIEPFRRELLAHSYRMLGSVDDAEDVVQETYLRAWRFHGGFEGRSSVRSWLYRIATNACLTALEQRGRRAMPSGLRGPEKDPGAPPAVAGPDVGWLQPIPDALVSPESSDPAVIAASRESLRFALIASLQFLPGRQRAVLLLRDVLGFPAGEDAEMLGTTTAAVKSTLQRARARLEGVADTADRVTEPAEPEARALLDRYIAAFETSDVAALERLLCRDATLEATPVLTWFAGRATCLPFLVTRILGSPGDWRMVSTRANGQAAAVAYLRGGDGAHHAYGIVMLTVRGGGVARIRSFGDPGLVAAFGFPPLWTG